MATVTTLQRSKLSEQLALSLTDAILDGTYAPDRPLPTERELAARYLVSVGVVREAVRRLAAIGLVEVRHGVGMFVTPVDHWNPSIRILSLMRHDPRAVLRVHAVRSPLEVMSAQEAALRAGEDDIAALERAVVRMETTVEQRVATIEADLDFHVALARSTHNPVLLVVLQPLIEPIHECMLRSAGIAEAAIHAVNEHHTILAAVRAHDADAARVAMVRHMETNHAELLIQLAADE